MNVEGGQKASFLALELQSIKYSTLLMIFISRNLFDAL